MFIREFSDLASTAVANEKLKKTIERGIIEKLRNETGLDVIAYFACYGLGPADIDAVLDSYAAIGLDNILAVRGDPPHDDEFKPHPESLVHASDLVAYIKPRYQFSIGVAGYPEAHIDASSAAQDMEYLKLKVDNGAEFIITNYCYDNSYFFDFVARCRVAGIEVPIIPGVMPIYSVKMLEMPAGLCGATITDEIRQGLAALPADDKEALAEFGADFATRQCAELLRHGVPGLHIYTMNRSSSATAVVGRLKEQGLLSS